jgi:beta-lactamase superfamily II metal-dependent hydrolase
MKRLLITLFWITACVIAKADYLVVSRAATIKAEPNNAARVLERVSEGEILLLIEPSQSPNGYYHVRHPDRSTTGWIYRTLVRRMQGDAPGFPDTFTPASGEDLIVHVVDVGAGLCTVIQLPDGRYILYDLGDQHRAGETVYDQIASLIPPGSPIEMLVLSHTDADHIGASQQVLERYRVKKIIHTGFDKTMVVGGNKTETLKRLYKALDEIGYPIDNTNLNEGGSNIVPGTSFTFGAVRVVLLCGFGDPLESWNLPASDYSKRVNGVSITMRLEYAGQSIFFGGDAVGRFDGKPDDDLRATEHYLVNNAAQWLDSDIVIAPHHGADNGSSTAFIQATSPEYVIFSAGHKHRHPRQATADRYLTAGVRIENMLRTDRGDDERRPDKEDDEWAYDRIPGCQDLTGDDDIEIIISSSGAKIVRYKNANDPCVQDVAVVD